MTAHQHSLPGWDLRPEFIGDTHEVALRRTSYIYELRLGTDLDMEEDMALVRQMESLLVESGARHLAGSYDTARCEFVYRLWMGGTPLVFLITLGKKWRDCHDLWELRVTLELLEINDANQVISNFQLCSALDLSRLSFED